VQSDRGFTKDRERLLEAQVAESSAPLATSSKKGMRRRLFHNGLAAHPKFAPKAPPRSTRWSEVWLKRKRLVSEPAAGVVKDFGPWMTSQPLLA
jgi:hypothetical protein